MTLLSSGILVSFELRIGVGIEPGVIVCLVWRSGIMGLTFEGGVLGWNKAQACLTIRISVCYGPDFTYMCVAYSFLSSSIARYDIALRVRVAVIHCSIHTHCPAAFIIERSPGALRSLYLRS